MCDFSLWSLAVPLQCGHEKGQLLVTIILEDVLSGNKILLCVAGIRSGTPPPTRIGLGLRLSPHSSSAMGNKGIKFTPSLHLRQ